MQKRLFFDIVFYKARVICVRKTNEVKVSILFCVRDTDEVKICIPIAFVGETNEARVVDVIIAYVFQNHIVLRIRATSKVHLLFVLCKVLHKVVDVIHFKKGFSQ